VWSVDQCCVVPDFDFQKLSKTCGVWTSVVWCLILIFNNRQFRFFTDFMVKETADFDSFRNTKEPAVFMKELAKNLGS
jgi:hypothetical protein